MGFVRDIIVATNYKRDDKSKTVIIEGPDYNRSKFFNDPDRHIYIQINPFIIFSKQANHTRTQILISLGYVMVIHKSLGQTLKKTSIDLRNSDISLGLNFVGLSRLKHIINF